MSLSHKTVLITGASAGLGLTIAQTLLASGKYRLILTARESSIPRFAELGIYGNEQVTCLPLDICNFTQSENIAHEIIQKFGSIDFLINNAGISYRTVVEHMSAADEEYQMRVNYFGAFHLIRQFLPIMRKRRSGHIINISSVGGMMAMPTMASYSASKFALEGASEALWYELKPWNVHVSLVQLGFIHSNSFQKVLMTPRAAASAHDTTNDYHIYYASMGPFVEKLMLRTFATTQTITNKILALMNHPNPPLRISGTPDAFFFVFLRRIAPRFFYHWLLYRNLPNIRLWGKSPDGN